MLFKAKKDAAFICICIYTYIGNLVQHVNKIITSLDCQNFKSIPFLSQRSDKRLQHLLKYGSIPVIINTFPISSQLSFCIHLWYIQTPVTCFFQFFVGQALIAWLLTIPGVVLNHWLRWINTPAFLPLGWDNYEAYFIKSSRSLQ